MPIIVCLFLILMIASRPVGADHHLLVIGLEEFDTILSQEREAFQSEDLTLFQFNRPQEPFEFSLINRPFSFTPTFELGVDPISDGEGALYGLSQVLFDTPFTAFTPKLQTSISTADRLTLHSQIALEYYFHNQVKLSFAYDHTSRENGKSVFSLWYHFPMSWWFFK